MLTETNQIGSIASVDSDRIVIDLDPGTTGLVKGGPSGVLPVGTINSYITVPAGPSRLVAVITAIRIGELPPRGRDPYAAEESVLRRVEAVLVGRFERGDYLPGITTYPSLFAPVSSATPDEIRRIFSPGEGPSITIGEAVVAPGIDVRLDANKLLARHSAILGSTGAGKSCTVTAIVEQLLELSIPSSNILIFDSNGEYTAAFETGTPRGDKANVVAIGPETGPAGALTVPHWFMDNEDHLALLRAGEGAQAPLLQRAIVDARVGSSENRGLLTMLLHVRTVCDQARQILLDPEAKRPQGNLHALLSGFAETASKLAASSAGEERAIWETLATAAADFPKTGVKDSWDPLDLELHQNVEAFVADLEGSLAQAFDRLGLGSAPAAADFDAPRYYSLEELNSIYLPYRIALESVHEPRIRGYATTLLMRLSRLLADTRYNFMTRVPKHDAALARFLRLLLGTDPLRRATEEASPAPWENTYAERSHDRSNFHSVTILDLSLIASDVLENVTALLGRLVLDFLQRVQPRGSLPALLVLEEGHRYIPEGEETRSRVTFERIAKEGRKFGLGLMIASQRPSELARTVLAQCGTLIAHRTVNPADQDLIRHATPFASRDVLNQLPGLGTQHAIVLGEAAPIPSYVRIRDVANAPMGKDPDFIGRWQEEPSDTDQFERITHVWEEGEEPTTQSPAESGGDAADLAAHVEAKQPPGG